MVTMIVTAGDWCWLASCGRRKLVLLLGNWRAADRCGDKSTGAELTWANLAAVAPLWPGAPRNGDWWDEAWWDV